MLTSQASLLRAWRRQLGWTQDHVAHTVRVSRAAVASWESGARQAPSEALQALDFEWVADGCLVDLVRAVDSPQGYRTATGPLPRRHWAHVFVEDPGPVWAWVRPASGERVVGYTHTGPWGTRFDEVTGPDGLFVIRPWTTAGLPMRITLSEPGWVDFGRGPVPPWLQAPARSTAGLTPVEIVNPDHAMVGFYAQRLRELDRGDPATLGLRLRALLDPARADLLADRLPADQRRDDQLCDGQLQAPGDPRPPQTPQDRVALHRRLRRVRGMSQSAAAAAASVLLAKARRPDGAAVTRQQIHNYEAGRASRVRYLPALLDVVYGASGWSCWEPVRITRTGEGSFEADFPDWWVGPVGLTLRPSARPSVGVLALTARLRCSQSPLPQGVLLPQGVRTSLTYEHLRLPDEPPLRIQVPPGWGVHVHMGHAADAIDTDRSWQPSDPAAAGPLLDLALQAWLDLLGRSRADLDRVLGIASGGTLRAS